MTKTELSRLISPVASDYDGLDGAFRSLLGEGLDLLEAEPIILGDLPDELMARLIAEADRRSITVWDLIAEAVWAASIAKERREAAVRKAALG